MSDHYPPPAHAAMVWTNGTRLFIRTEGADGAHTVDVPLTETGLAVFARALRDRHAAYANHEATTIATAAARTQAQMRALVSAMSAPAKRLAPTARELRPTPERLSALSAEDLDLLSI